MKTALLGCKGTTLDLLNSIVSEASFDLDLVITLPEHLAVRNNVAFYRASDIMAYCERHTIRCHVVCSYDLQDKSDSAFFRAEKIDLLLVIGWERIIPTDVLNGLDKFACGMHGSAYGLPKGRGRSPLNWSILTGRTRFITCLFRYNPGIDDGHIIGFKVFDVNQFDTIGTLHAKNRIAMYQLLKMYVPLIAEDRVTFMPQPPEKTTFYPKRTPDDSGIDWNQSALQIYDLVRAVGLPYPPAYCYHNGNKLFILEAFPFETGLFHHSIAPGTIVDVSLALEHFVVKALDDTLIVKKFSGARIQDLRVGDVLQGIDQRDVMQDIIHRYPPDVGEDEREI